MTVLLNRLGPSGLERFAALKEEAIDAVTERFFSTHGALYEHVVARGRQGCRQDLAQHLDFAEPVLEFGFIEPMIDYLRWLDGQLSARSIPTEHVVLSLDWLAAFYMKRMSDADAALITAAFAAVLDGFLNGRDAVPNAFKPPDALPATASFESALIGGKVGEAHAILNDCLDAGTDLLSFEMHVVQPALYTIGRKWEANELTTAQEHLATAIAQSVMTAGLLRVPPPPEKGRRVLLACVEGNTHGVGLRIVADAFALEGWEVECLGANVTAKRLLAAAERSNPDVVALSVSLSQQFRAARAVIAKLRDSLSRRPPRIIIGGLAINRFTMLATLAGADAYCAEPRSAVKFASLRALEPAPSGFSPSVSKS